MRVLVLADRPVPLDLRRCVDQPEDLIEDLLVQVGPQLDVVHPARVTGIIRAWTSPTASATRVIG
jgi:hypothetical protein